MAAFEIGERRLRTPARWRSAPIPDNFGKRPFTGEAGIVRLPIHLWWSGESIERDMTIPAQRRRIYEIVLQVGTAEDVEHFIDPRQLCADWDNMTRPAAVMEIWQPWVDQHCPRC